MQPAKYIVATIATLMFVSIANAQGAPPAGGRGMPAKGEMAQAVDGACKSDAAAAGCGAEQVGTGLLRCLHAYKHANKGYKFSDSCKSAMMQMHEHHMEKMQGKTN